MTELSDLPLRGDLVGRVPYGAPQISVPVRLNVNENTHRLPQALAMEIMERVAEAVLHINRYPDREFSNLRTALARYVGRGVSDNQIWAANGSNEVLQQIFQAFGGPGRTALSFTPSYSMYPLLAQGTGTSFVEQPRPANFELSVELVANAITENSPNLVIICSPNNPTGTPVSLEVIEAAYDALQAVNGGVLIVDEAYYEFAHDPEQTAVKLLAGRPKLLVSRTMSKAFAFAGARLGYLVADSAVCDALRLVRLPYHLSSFTQAASEAALKYSDELLANVEDIKTQRDRIVNELQGMGLSPYRSDANFVLFGDMPDPQLVWQGLLERGVLVRNVGIDGTLRVSAGTESETTAFLEALRQVFAG